MYTAHKARAISQLWVRTLAVGEPRAQEAADRLLARMAVISPHSLDHHHRSLIESAHRRHVAELLDRDRRPPP